MSNPHGGSSTEHRAVYDWTNVTPSAAILETLAAATGADELDLSPLYESVDPDALDKLVGRQLGGRAVGPTEVAFRHEGFDVVVGSGGTVRLSPTADA